ncbi:MAG: glycosyltransferase family 9 protein [Armatimonadota bacterium]|nr:glycosyltransferase family 9 protein [Armatimonadota bacterium]MDW8143750.1 glycosyltransferase family 9 protein [Armatimonadota bacterium]
MAREWKEAPPLGAAPRILIVRLSALGDTLMSTPIAQALREAFPNAYIGWVVETRCAPILEGNPFINRVHRWDKTLTGFIATVREIRRERYELALDVQGLLKSALIPWLARIPYRVGFVDAREGANRLLTHSIPPPPPANFASHRNLQLLSALGIPADPQRHRLFFPLTDYNRQIAIQRLTSLGVEPKRFAVLAPATTRPQKHWIENRWSELAERLWHELKLPCVLLGARSDLPLLERIARNCKVPLPVICDLSLKDAVAVIELSSVLIGPDSFPIHAALAVRTPTIALFGPNDPFRFRSEEGILVLEHDLPCRPCRRRPTCGGAFTCMALITVDEVVAAVEKAIYASN